MAWSNVPPQRVEIASTQDGAKSTGRRYERPLMSHEELTAALETLHRELTQSDDLDSEDVAGLRATMNEIQSVLDQQSESPDTLSSRVSNSAKRFEESHPVLTDSLGRIADILQQMGI